MDALVLWARAEIRHGWRSLVVLAMMIALVVGSVAALVAGARRAGSAVERFTRTARTAEGDRGGPARSDLIANRFAPIPLPSELDNLDQAGLVPWVLAAFLGGMALAGLLQPSSSCCANAGVTS